MQERHKNKEIYFQEQAKTTEKYVIPYLADILKITPQTQVLEIGCGEAGNLKPFLDLGCKVTGVDISCGRIELANDFFESHPKKENLELICSDIYKADFKGELFDLIFMRDVIEHIPNQRELMNLIKNLLNDDGKLFVAFPPWQNPFGGHQQMCQNKVVSKTPWIHLLPRPVYKKILDSVDKNRARVTELLEIKETGISIERFEKILKDEDYIIDKKTLYLINPNYETKFGLKPRRQIKIISQIPRMRNFFTTAAYYIVSNRDKNQQQP